MKTKGKLGIVGALIVIVIASLSVFTVDQTKQAIVIQLGKPLEVYTAPGSISRYPSFSR